jgi:hypothetical protein
VARYGQRYKGGIVARPLPPESSAVDVVSRAVGISVATLERWRAEGLAGGQRWTAAARLQAVIATAAMDEATRSAWCREQGLYPLDAWKQDAIAGLGEPRVASAAKAREGRRRVKELERQLATARTRRWPKRPPCWGCQKTARTHDPPGRPPDPDPRHHASPRERRLAPACALAGIDIRTPQRWNNTDGLVHGDRRPDAERSVPCA